MADRALPLLGEVIDMNFYKDPRWIRKRRIILKRDEYMCRQCRRSTSMLKSCSYCGRIHDKKYDCGKKPQRTWIKNKRNDKDKFRSTSAWTIKSLEIRERDKFLCQICIRKLYDTVQQYTYDNLSVHHAVPLEEDYDKRLDNDNLLTICERHHRMAEDGRIPRAEILRIIKEQENK